MVTGGGLSRGITEVPVQVGDRSVTAAQLDKAGGLVELRPGPIFASAALSGAWFFRSWFGVGTELRVDPVRFSFSPASSMGSSGSDPSRETGTTFVASGALLALLRWQPSGLLGFEAQVGWTGAQRPLVFGADMPRSVTFATMGGGVGLAVNLEPSRHLWLQLYGRFEYVAALQEVLVASDPTSLSGNYGQLSGSGWTGGLQARVASVAVGPVELGVGVLAELSAASLRGPDPNPGEFQSVVQGGPLRVGLGLAVQSRSEPPAVLPPPPPPAAPRQVRGVVIHADRTPVAGARVTLGSASVDTGADGAFEVADPPAGAQVVTATAAGLRPASVKVTVVEGVTRVELVLETPTGPGQLRGVIRAAPGTPLASATVVSGASQAVSQADGTYALEAVGPGPIAVRVTLPGYTPAEELLQVRPETIEELDVTLVPVAQGTKAKLRGVVSSADGAVSKAVVRVVELTRQKVPVKADGRFEFDVPAGKYTIVIEAPKYVTQTKRIEVAPGEQAIFQIELEKAR